MLNWLRYLIREFSYFSPTLKKGTWFLIILIIIIQMIIFSFKYYSLHHLSDLEKNVIIYSTKLLKEDSINKIKEPLKNYKIDPNKATEADFIKLGFPSYIAKRIIKYRDKGGKFRHIKDLKKIYGIDTNIINQLEDCLIFPSFSLKSTHDYKKIELNKVDSAMLESLPGIGKTLSKRIIKYREILGGFYSKEQLKEVYGLSLEVYNNIIPHFIIDTTQIKRIDINNVSYHELVKHPYIRKELANKIIHYRKKKNITSLQQLISDSILFPKEAERLRWYFIF